MCQVEQCPPVPPVAVTQQCQQTQTGSPCELCPVLGSDECRAHAVRRGTAPELVRAPRFVLRQGQNSGNEGFYVRAGFVGTLSIPTVY